MSNASASTVSDNLILDLNGSLPGVDATVTFIEQRPVQITTGVTITDLDTTTLTSFTATLNTRPDGDAAESLSFNKSALISLNPFSRSYDPATGVLTVTGSGSVTTYLNILNGLIYNDTSDNPSTAARTVTIVVSNGIETSTATSTINVAPVNDAPVVVRPQDYFTTEQTTLTLKGTGWGVNDVDAQGGIETITLAVGEGILHAVAGDSGVTIDSGDNTSSLQISGTIAQLNALLGTGGTSNLTFFDNNDNPLPVTLQLTLNDNGHTGSGGAKSASLSAEIFFTAIDDAPVNHLGGPFQAQSGINLPLASLSISDPDAGSGILTTTLSVAHGTLSMASDGGATVAGSGSAAVTLTGTLSQINTTLGATNNVLYHSDANFVGSDALTVTTDDNGNTGLGGPLTVTNTVGINVQSATLPAGDGHFGTGVSSDFLLRNDDGTFRVDQVSSGQDHAVILGPVGLDLNFLGAGDFNGDGRSDFLIQRNTDHLLGVDEVAANLGVTFAPLGQVGAEWHFLGTGDFNGDHTSDTLWQRDDGMLRVYDFNNYQVSNAPLLGTVGSNQHFVGIGDFNGDGTSDILFRSDTGLLQIDDIGNNQVTQPVVLGAVGNDLQVAAIADFNGDHTSDLLMQRSDGSLFLDTIVNNHVVGSQPLVQLAADTHVAGTGDFNNDGTADLLLRHDDGTFQVDTFQNGHIAQTITLGQVGNDWHIV